MARTNTYKCAVCGTTYEFCMKCKVSRPDYDAEKFCSKTHANLYATLSKHGCNLITADEALKELSVYNLDEITLAEDIATHIERIKSEAGVRTENGTKTETIVVPTEIVEAIVEEVTEKPIVKNNNKKNKKKW